MILVWLCRFNVPNYCLIIIVNITFLDFHISIQLFSETSFFHKFYELSFIGIDQTIELINNITSMIKLKKWYVFYVLSHIIYLFLKYSYNLWSINKFNKNFNPDSLWLTPLRSC